MKVDMTNDYINSKLCNERHTRIDTRLGILENKMEKIESRLTASLTALVLNLVGVIVILALAVLKG